MILTEIFRRYGAYTDFVMSTDTMQLTVGLWHHSTRVAEQCINNVISLRHNLTHVYEIVTCLAPLDSPLLNDIRRVWTFLSLKIEH